MAQKIITVEGSSDMDVLTRIAAVEEILKLPTAELKRLKELSKIPKAKGYLESEIKFQSLKLLLK